VLRWEGWGRSEGRNEGGGVRDEGGLDGRNKGRGRLEGEE